MNKQDIVSVHESTGRLDEEPCPFVVDAVSDGDAIVRVGLKGAQTSRLLFEMMNMS